MDACPRLPHRHRAARGFTLVELIVVLGVVALVGVAAAPGFRSFVDAMGARDASMDLVADLTIARSEALKRNTAITMSPPDGNWGKGWQLRSADTLIRERGALRAGISLDAPAGGVTFLPNGRLSDSDLMVSNVAWSIVSSNASVPPRCVVITPTGSARSRKGSCE